MAKMIGTTFLGFRHTKHGGSRNKCISTLFPLYGDVLSDTLVSKGYTSLQSMANEGFFQGWQFWRSETEVAL